jgi:hypothetical protein
MCTPTLLLDLAFAWRRPRQSCRRSAPNISNQAFKNSDFDLERLYELVSVPNDMLKEHYGTRMRFSMDVAEKPNAISWSAKFDDVIEPIAILILKAPDARYDAVKCDVDGTPKNDEPFLHALGKEIDMRMTHGCSRTAFFFDGKNLVPKTVIAQTRTQKVEAELRIVYSITRGVTYRYYLLIRLGNTNQTNKDHDVVTLTWLHAKRIDR